MLGTIMGRLIFIKDQQEQGNSNATDYALQLGHERIQMLLDSNAGQDLQNIVNQALAEEEANVARYHWRFPAWRGGVVDMLESAKGPQLPDMKVAAGG
jgi:hypothetical protein